MSGIAYLQVDAIPVLVLGILLANSALRMPYSSTSKLFRVLVCLLMAACAFDALSWTCDGRAPAPLLYAVNIVLGLLMAGFSFAWFVYVCAVAFGYGGLRRHRSALVVALLHLAAFVAASAVTPWTHVLFSIDAGGRYQVGGLPTLVHALEYGYLVAASAVALFWGWRETYPWKRRRLFDLALFVVVPLCGALLQVVFDGLALLLPSLAVSVLLVYVALQRDEISMDGLTGLGNRSSFEDALAHRCGAEAARPWCLVLLDIDDFKQVNDRLGHTAGDEVLRMMAQALRAVFGRKNAVLARYGGDEFVVFYDGADEAEARCAVGEVERVLEDIRLLKGWEAPIRFSAGYASAAPGERRGPVEAVNAADAAMYRAKAGK